MRFIHIGIHKTASKFLQLGVFADTGLAVIGTPSAPEALHTHCREIWSRDDKDLDLDQWRTTFCRMVDAHGIDPARLALSDENLSGHIWTGAGYLRNAYRLANLWPTAPILIVLRNPAEYILAAYDEYCRLGGAAPLNGLLRDRLLPGMAILRRLDYGRLTDHYAALFGCHRVLVLPYEHLRDEPAEFVTSVSTHCKIDPRPEIATGRVYNPRPSRTERFTLRMRNFVGRPRPADWERSIAGSKAGRYLARSATVRSNRKVMAALARLEDTDSVLPAGSPREHAWAPRFRRYQPLYAVPLRFEDYPASCDWRRCGDPDDQRSLM
jgi:hypothetical protein